MGSNLLVWLKKNLYSAGNTNCSEIMENTDLPLQLCKIIKTIEKSKKYEIDVYVYALMWDQIIFGLNKA